MTMRELGHSALQQACHTEQAQGELAADGPQRAVAWRVR